MTMLKLLMVIMIFPLGILSIWPPPYEIKLNHVETFVISEFSETDDLLDDEDEMIKPFKTDDGKYRRIHQLVIRQNRKEMNDEKRPSRNINKIKERNFDLEDPMPWEGGFVDKNGNFIQNDNENVYYLNEMAKTLIDDKINRKREEKQEQSDDKVENYDYNHFKAEYNAEIKKVELQNDTLNFTDTKEDETLTDAIKTVVEVKEIKNCTREEMKGIGFSAFKCIFRDLQRSNNKNSTIALLERILKITLIWFSIYLVIVTTCWCYRGWCCCCCCCKCCRPREMIDEAKMFYMNNPVGTVHTANGEKIQYQPTHYEIYAQKRLEKALFRL